MTITCNARFLICDYIRRKISPDKKMSVTQGTLELWLVNNEFAALVRLSDQKTTIRGACLYINTYGAQEIADHVMTEDGLTSAEVKMIQLMGIADSR